jgi:hypothetical protein
MAYNRASGDGEYQVPSPKSGHDDRVTPDERAPTHLWSFPFWALQCAVIPAERKRVPESTIPVIMI